jgi:hypothetical protein
MKMEMKKRRKPTPKAEVEEGKETHQEIIRARCSSRHPKWLHMSLA